MPATAPHAQLSEVVLLGITLMLVGLLLATVDHALEASPLPMGSAFGVGLP